MEQRYQAVSAVTHDGLSVVEVTNRFGVSRQTLHSWLLKYEKRVLPGLSNHSHKPQSCAHQMSAQINVLICEMRRRNPSGDLSESLMSSRREEWKSSPHSLGYIEHVNAQS
jgi:transposase